MMHKKGDLYTNWAELSFLVLFLIGLFLSIFADSSSMAYVFSMIGGIMSGKFIYQKRLRYPLAYYFIVAGYLFGIVLGGIITKDFSWKLASILFIILNMVSYYIFSHQMISD